MKGFIAALILAVIAIVGFIIAVPLFVTIAIVFACLIGLMLLFMLIVHCMGAPMTVTKTVGDKKTVIGEVRRFKYHPKGK